MMRQSLLVEMVVGEVTTIDRAMVDEMTMKTDRRMAPEDVMVVMMMVSDQATVAGMMTTIIKPVAMVADKKHLAMAQAPLVVGSKKRTTALVEDMEDVKSRRVVDMVVGKRPSVLVVASQDVKSHRVVDTVAEKKQQATVVRMVVEETRHQAMAEEVAMVEKIALINMAQVVLTLAVSAEEAAMRQKIRLAALVAAMAGVRSMAQVVVGLVVSAEEVVMSQRICLVALAEMMRTMRDDVVATVRSMDLVVGTEDEMSTRYCGGLSHLV